MPTTRNLLSRTNSLLVTDENGRALPISGYAHDWELEPGNGTFSLISTDYLVDSRYSFRISPSNTNDITIKLLDVPLVLKDNGETLSFNCRVKSSSEVTVSSLLYINSVTPADVAHNEVFSAGLYNGAHSNTSIVPDNQASNFANVEITISGHQAKTLYLTCPHLINELAFYSNPFVPSIRRYMPDFYFEYDSVAEFPSYPLYRLVDILTSAAGDTRLEHDAMWGYENYEILIAEGMTSHWAHSVLTSPRSIRNDYIPWALQFVGANLVGNIQLADGSLYFNNTQTVREFLEWQLAGGYFGTNAGTRRAIIHAVQQVTTRTVDGEESTRSVAVSPIYNGDPFALHIQTLTNETIDADAGETSQAVMTIATLAKPAGFLLTHTTVDEFSFTFDDPSLGVFDDLTWG